VFWQLLRVEKCEDISELGSVGFGRSISSKDQLLSCVFFSPSISVGGRIALGELDSWCSQDKKGVATRPTRLQKLLPGGGSLVAGHTVELFFAFAREDNGVYYGATELTASWAARWVLR
ncbi:unnamed protein product, partial [Symbiodinium natans]